MPEVKENHAMTTDVQVARRWMRTLHTGDLMQLHTGKGPFNPLKRSKVVAAEAKRQLQIRQKIGDKVRGVLKTLGHSYSGTGGWHISVFVTPDKEIAFVNTAHGVAVTTNITIDDDAIECLTVPEQAEGNLVSGAAAWTSPDAGEGHNAKSPPGWLQLLTDVRTNSDWKAEEGLQVKSRLVAYGLTTCYKEKGKPAFSLEPGYPKPDPSTWHFNGEQSGRVRSLIREWMITACKNVAAFLPNHQEIIAAFDSTTIKHDDFYKLANKYPDQEVMYKGERTKDNIEKEQLIWWKAEAARNSLSKLFDEFWIKRMYFSIDRENEVIGMRTYDYFAGLLTRAIVLKLDPVCESLRWCVANEDKTHESTFREYLGNAAYQIGKIFCHGLDVSARALIEITMVNILYENGPIYPCTSKNW